MGFYVFSVCLFLLLLLFFLLVMVKATGSVSSGLKFLKFLIVITYCCSVNIANQFGYLFVLYKYHGKLRFNPRLKI